jgi:hypothetical protein
MIQLRQSDIASIYSLFHPISYQVPPKVARKRTEWPNSEQNYSCAEKSGRHHAPGDTL